MNPNLQAVLVRWAVVGILGVALFAFGYIEGSSNEQVKAATFQGGVEALGTDAIKHVAEVKQQQITNLKEANHELQVKNKAAGDNAVSNYISRNPRWVCHSDPGKGFLPGPGASQQSDDGTGGERVAACRPDNAFIEACGRDAAKLGVWQSWAVSNGVPVQ